MPRADMPRHEDPTEIEPRPKPTPLRDDGATSSELRHDIDSGATGDKLPMLDPAAAPLGSDAEASGVPPAPKEVAVARRMERKGPRSPENPFGLGGDPAALRLVSGLAALILLGGLAVWLGTL